MLESTIVKEWKTEAGRKATIAAVLRVLQNRFGPVPADLSRVVNTCSDMERLNALLDAASTASSLDDFRRVTGI